MYTVMVINDSNCVKQIMTKYAACEKDALKNSPYNFQVLLCGYLMEKRMVYKWIAPQIKPQKLHNVLIPDGSENLRFCHKVLKQSNK